MPPDDPPKPLPDSAEALRSKIVDLERDRDADRQEIARLKTRLDALDEEVITGSEGDESDDVTGYL